MIDLCPSGSIVEEGRLCFRSCHGATVPWAVRVGEENLYAGLDGEARMIGELFAPSNFDFFMQSFMGENATSSWLEYFWLARISEDASKADRISNPDISSPPYPINSVTLS